MVYLYLVSYGRGKPDEIQYAIGNFLTASNATHELSLLLLTTRDGSRTAMTEIPSFELWQYEQWHTSRFPSSLVR